LKRVRVQRSPGVLNRYGERVCWRCRPGVVTGGDPLSRQISSGAGSCGRYTKAQAGRGRDLPGRLLVYAACVGPEHQPRGGESGEDQHSLGGAASEPHVRCAASAGRSPRGPSPALRRSARRDPDGRKAKVVELRSCGGISVETAVALKISPQCVVRGWRPARP
jgi:hypothetical protein